MLWIDAIYTDDKILADKVHSHFQDYADKWDIAIRSISLVDKTYLVQIGLTWAAEPDIIEQIHKHIKIWGE